MMHEAETGDLKLPDLTALIALVREAALEKNAEDVLALPLEGRTVVADYFILATGRSHVHTRAIADCITQRAREADFPAARREGRGDGGWVLLDLGSVVVHIFTPEQRVFYNLERLWGAPAQRDRRAFG
jgi:ribosome-associated protein